MTRTCPIQKFSPTVWILVTVFALFPVHALGQVTQVEIDSRIDILNGRPFGLAGAYEKLSGTVHFALDPEDPANQAIVGIELAPRNGDGLVEFSADLYVLKPKDANRGNGAILFDVVNRGSKVAVGLFNRAPRSADPTTERELGDGFLMERGFTVVWVGWQFDVIAGGGRMKVEVPVATENGESIEGPVRYWFRTNAPTRVQSLDGPARGTDPYPVVDPGSNMHRLTVREGDLDEPRVIPRNSWSFSRLENGIPVGDANSIYLEDGFEPGMLYEIVYQSRDPHVAGLGYAGVRDAISYLRNDTDLLGEVEHVYAFGNSQSGRFLRGFLYEGFNSDLAGRTVFDGVIANVAAAVRSGFNRRFVQPSLAEPARFPFSDVVQTDPVTGQTDSLLRGASDAGTFPMLFLTNSSNEYWTEWKGAALVHTSIDGREDLDLGENVRVYTLAGAQHGPGSFPPGPLNGNTRYLRNTNDYSWALRALLVAMDRWHRDGTLPPESRHPNLTGETLVGYDGLKFPQIPNVDIPGGVTGAYRYEDGDRFSEGIIDRLPPGRGAAYPVLLPQVDDDGNELAGIRLPDIAVPLATYTGWNLRHPDTGAPTQLARLIGSYFPFPRTRAEREASGDPRLSIEERYASRSEYIGLVTASALELVPKQAHSEWTTGRMAAVKLEA